MKPAYEMVDSADVKVGEECLTYHLTPWTWGELDREIANSETKTVVKVLRQLPPERNPEVLMRALEIAVAAFNALNVITQHGHIPATESMCIGKAISELESEAGDGAT